CVAYEATASRKVRLAPGMVPAHRNSGHQQNDNKGAEQSHHFIVLINLPLETELTEQIASVDPRIEVISTFGPAAPGSGEEAKRVQGPELDALLAQAEVLFSFGIPPEWLPKAPALRWVQLASAGSDQAFRAGIFRERPDLIVTTSSGLHEV